VRDGAKPPLRFLAVTTDAKLSPRSMGVTSSVSETKVATVFVVEPLTAIRELIANFLARLDGFRVVGVSGDRYEAERECERLKPDIAVIDWILLPDSSNINLAEAIRRCCPATKVIVFSAAAELHFVSDAIAAGVSGFVVKSATLETLLRALRTVAEGKQFFCPEMAGVLRDLLRRSSHGSGRASLLTHREKEILREIAKGHFSKEIAAKFDLSVFTVENIRRRIMRKTGLKSVAELTLHAVRLKLITAPTSGVAESDGGRHEVFQ
jgi:two-component system, NarL family, response regulator NreC